MRDFWQDHPGLATYLEGAAGLAPGLAHELKQLITLASELAYRDGYVDGMKELMKELINKGPRIAWVLFFVPILAERACSWPYGVIMSIKLIF
jgi:hypothetical protein